MPGLDSSLCLLDTTENKLFLLVIVACLKAFYLFIFLVAKLFGELLDEAVWKYTFICHGSGAAGTTKALSGPQSRTYQIALRSQTDHHSLDSVIQQFKHRFHPSARP